MNEKFDFLPVKILEQKCSSNRNYNGEKEKVDYKDITEFMHKICTEEEI